MELETDKKVSLADLNPKGLDFLELASSSWKIKLFFLKSLPLAFLARLRVEEVNETISRVSVPYNWMNTNPFKSSYFAVLTMAAELSTGIPCMSTLYKAPQKRSMLLTAVSGGFFKKAKERITFTCTDQAIIYAAAERAIASGEWEEAILETIGRNQLEEEVARFQFTWSIKVKQS